MKKMPGQAISYLIIRYLMKVDYIFP